MKKDWQQEKFTYPPARQDDVVDDYHGTAVADPYRWLENEESEETRAWTAAQNKITRRFLDENPQRPAIHRRLTALWNYTKYSTPVRKGQRYFFYKNEGLQDQAILYMKKGLDGEAVMVLDPNELSADGTAAITSQATSKDGTHLAYGVSYSGSDRQEIRIRNVDSGQDYEEVLQWCRFAAIAWRHDGQGFYYNRYPAPGNDDEAQPYSHNRLYWHQIGTPQAADTRVYERPDAPDLNLPSQISDDGRYIVLHVWHGSSSENRLYYRETAAEGDFVRLVDEPDASYEFVGNVEDTFYVLTDREAPNGRLVAIDLTNPDPANWQDIIPQQEDAIAFATIANQQLVVIYLHDAYHQIKLYDLNGVQTGEIDLPGMGTVLGLSGKPQQRELFFSFESFLTPQTIFRYDMETAESTLFHKPTINFDTTAYETHQIFFHSKDGTAVPMFVTHKKGLSLDGDNLALMYGYGGFNNSRTPFFYPSELLWLEKGGIFVQVNLRGGSEYGEAWHKAGMLDKKQNVFDDFIAAAEWLIDHRYTRPQRLAIMGRSNGGLLVAACMLQRPDLFGAVRCDVPVTDMLRYHKFTAGRYWVPEYGNAEENPEHFNFLIAYSPLHNVKPGLAYPPTIITTGDTDDRVVPLHAKKFTAALQTAASGPNPLLLRVDTRAGHGMGKPTRKLIDEHSDIYTFLLAVLDSDEG